MLFRFHQRHASLKHFCSREENISVSVFFILCSHCTIVTSEKELKVSVSAMQKKCQYFFFSKCQKNKDFTKIQQEIQKSKETGNRYYQYLCFIASSEGHMFVINS